MATQTHLPHQSIINETITPEHVRYYHQNGFLVASNLIQEQEISQLKSETARIFRGERGEIEGLLKTAQEATDEEVLKKYIAIHFPHKVSAVIHEFLHHPKIVNILTHIISPNVKCMQSMLFVKAPGKAGQAWHQDEYYIPTRDCSLTGAWIAIDDATIENGCLWIIPGTHKPSYIMPRIKNTSNEYSDEDTIDITPYSHRAIPVEVKRGSVVFFNGYTLHSSLRNKTTDCFRTALVNHYMSAESMLPWDQDGKLQPTEDLRDIVMVAGVDPYAHKPLVDANRPYLRPEVMAAINKS